MGVDLDGAPRRGGPWVDIEPQRPGQPPGAGAVGELRFSRVDRVCTGFEPAKVAVKRRLGGALAGGVGHHQRRVEGDQAVVVHVWPHGGQYVGVVAESADMHQMPVCVEHRDAGRIAHTPGEVDADEVHRLRLGRAVCHDRHSGLSGSSAADWRRMWRM